MDYNTHNLDHGRVGRTGVPEVIFCEGKEIHILEKIVEEMIDRNVDIIGTRASLDQYNILKEKFHSLKYNSDGKIIYTGEIKKGEYKGKCIVVTAGSSDFKVAEEAAFTMELLGIEVLRNYDCGVAGLHRILDSVERIENADVAVVVAGMDGALPGVVGGLVSTPVIAVPTGVGYGAAFGGIGALLTMLNSCSPGVSVVNIDNGFGAGIMAFKIINKMR